MGCNAKLTWTLTLALGNQSSDDVVELFSYLSLLIKPVRLATDKL